MAKIYTKTGDNGTTGVLGGRRMVKSSILLSNIGTLDELNANLGLARAELDISYMGDAVIARILDRIQDELFRIGEVLALSDRTEEIPVEWMEEEIDQFDTVLPKLRNFIIPGGSRLAAQLMVSRAVCRRLERALVVVLDGPFFIPTWVQVYVNRLSDLLFVLARYANAITDYPEKTWTR